MDNYNRLVTISTEICGFARSGQFVVRISRRGRKAREYSVSDERAASIFKMIDNPTFEFDDGLIEICGFVQRDVPVGGKEG